MNSPLGYLPKPQVDHLELPRHVAVVAPKQEVKAVAATHTGDAAAEDVANKHTPPQRTLRNSRYNPQLKNLSKHQFKVMIPSLPQHPRIMDTSSPR